MKLWTHHPSNFRLDDPEIRVDARKGEYWKSDRADFHYQTVLPILHERLGSDQILWCCTTRGRYMPMGGPEDLVEWELELSLSEVVLYSVPIWEDIVWSRTDSWDSLFQTGLTETEAANKNVGALVRLPLAAECLTYHGQLPSMHLENGKPNPSFRTYLESIGINYLDWIAGRY